MTRMYLSKRDNINATCVTKHLFTNVTCCGTRRENTWGYLDTDVKFATEDFQIKAILKDIWCRMVPRSIPVLYVEEVTLIKRT